MIKKIGRYCAVACLALSVPGCASHKQEERLTALESQAAGQQVLDMRLARVEDRLTSVEQQLVTRQEPGKDKRKKTQKQGVEPSPASFAVPRSAMGKQVAEAEKGPRKIDPGPSLAAVGKPVPSAGEHVAPPLETGHPSAVDAALQEVRDLSPGKVTTSTPKSGAVSVAPGTKLPQPRQEPKTTPVPAPQPAAPSGGDGNPEQSAFISPSSAPQNAFSFQGPQDAERGEAVAPSTAAPRRVSMPEAASAPVKQVQSNKGVDGGHAGQGGYDAALRTYERGDMKKSLELFDAFIQAHPQNSLVPNALYWQGECYYSMGQHTSAIMKFKSVAERYPKHAKSAAALLKIGYSYAKLNDMENARFYWEILLEDFPQSQPATLAKKRLAEK